MKPKTFMLVLLGCGVFAALSTLFYSNRMVLGERFAIWPAHSIPFYTVLGVSFLAGLLIALAFSVTRESRQALDRWRENRIKRESLAVDEICARGVEAMADGRPAVALEHLRNVLAREPHRVDALLKTGEILRMLGRLEEARDLHLKAHQAVPENPAPLHELVADAEAQNDLPAARTYLTQLIKLKPEGALSAYRRLRQIHIREKHWQQALEDNEQIHRIRPQADREEASDRMVGQGISFEIGAELQRAGNSKEAEARLRRILKEEPRFVPAWRTLGEVRVQAGDPEGAVNIWQEGYQKTCSPVLLTRIQQHFLGEERPDRAIEALRRAVASASKDTIPRFFLGKLYYRLEMLDEALVEFSALKDRAAYTPTLCYYLARIHERRGRYPEASTEYRRIIRERQLLSTQFHCLTCDEHTDAWTERCAHCGDWNSIEVDFKEDLSLEELGISTAPVYSTPRR